MMTTLSRIGTALTNIHILRDKLTNKPTKTLIIIYIINNKSDFSEFIGAPVLTRQILLRTGIK